MAFKRSAVRSRLSPPKTDRKANALRSELFKKKVRIWTPGKGSERASPEALPDLFRLSPPPPLFRNITGYQRPGVIVLLLSKEGGHRYGIRFLLGTEVSA